MDIANGVLGIRNMGGVAKEVFPLRDSIAAGRRMRRQRLSLAGPSFMAPIPGQIRNLLSP